MKDKPVRIRWNSLSLHCTMLLWGDCFSGATFKVLLSLCPCLYLCDVSCVSWSYIPILLSPFLLKCSSSPSVSVPLCKKLCHLSENRNGLWRFSTTAELLAAGSHISSQTMMRIVDVICCYHFFFLVDLRCFSFLTSLRVLRVNSIHTHFKTSIKENCLTKISTGAELLTK
jgi:hypothetical protein